MIAGWSQVGSRAHRRLLRSHQVSRCCFCFLLFPLIWFCLVLLIIEMFPGAGSPSSSPVQCEDTSAITKKCSVRLAHLDLDVKNILKMDEMLAANPVPGNSTKDIAAKRDNEHVHEDGPLTKKQKSEDIIVIESDTKPLERVLKPVTPDVTVTKLGGVPTKDSKEANPTQRPEKRADQLNSIASPEARSKGQGEKPILQRTSSFDSSAKKSDNTPKSKMSSTTSSSASSSSGSSSNHDRTDRTSLQCLEQKLLDLKQKAQAKSDKSAAAEIHSSKPKSLSPSGVKQNKEFIHRRKEDFITNSEGRKKTSLSPMKKTIKKSLSLPAGKDNKMGNLFCPTTDAKVTILPCNKPNGKDVDLKPASAANSVTITKLSSGDSLNVPPKDIKKMFNSKSEMKTKTSSGHSKLSMKKSSGDKQRLSSGEKLHRDHKSRERNREEGGGKQRHIGCSKCREQFSTKEAKKLHTCNSILDAHYLIDGGDRQKTSPTSSVSTSESNSASLSRSSSRSSSPGLPSAIVNTVKKTPTTPTGGETPKLKISMKPGEKSSEKPKVRKEDCSDKMKVKRDSMKEKWVESKSSSQKSDIHGDDLVTKDDRTRITIEAMKPEESDSGQEKTAGALEIVRMEGAKDDSTVGAGDRIDHAFAFTGKRTYSPSMSETASVEGKGEF